jgi:F-type H+-transporting ATPase subunit b
MRTPSHPPRLALIALAAFLAVAALAAVASPAVAVAAQAPEAGVEAPHGAEAAHGGGEGGLFAGDVGNAVWTVLIFVLVLVVLGKFAWTPILQGLQARETFIRDALAEAKQQRDDAEARMREYEAKLAAAREEVDAIMDEARRDADVLRQREEARAKEEADKIVARARREIEIASETAVKDLYARATRLATSAAAAVLGREIRAEDHERLVSESIAALDGMRGDGGGPPIPPPSVS